MNYLQLCQAVIDEVGLSGQISSVANQRGDFQRVVRFVTTACQQIEGKWINWRFLHGIHEFQTAEGVNTYPVPESLNLRQWDIQNAFVDQLEIDIMYADDFRYKKDLIGENFTSRPIRIIIERNKSLRTIGTPDMVYNVHAEYYRRATVLTDNTDLPAMPEQFHEIIVFEAVRRYANYDEAPELKQQAIEQLYGVGGTWARPEPGSWLFQLQADQLPNSYLEGSTQGGSFVVRAE
ncbi:head completion adaptor [Vibrio phage 1.232.O._10N.261.51.E11]|nr:head completion adaptor [Vibrio phage 1.232.O._10N.261.51.E11]